AGRLEAESCDCSPAPLGTCGGRALVYPGARILRRSIPHPRPWVSAMTGSEPRFHPPAARFRVLVSIGAVWLFANGRRVYADEGALVSVGVAEIDITPAYPVRMTGYGGRRTELEGVEQRITARALAIGGDARGNDANAVSAPFVLVTVENCGVP